MLNNHNHPAKKSEESKPEEKTATTEDEKLEELIKKSRQVLFRANSAFIFDFSPSELIIDENRVIVITHQLFGAEQVYTVPIKQINEVSMQHDPFFATLKIIDKRSKEPAIPREITVKYLRKDEAARARQIIEGLLFATEQGIDISKINIEHLIEDIEKLGRVGEDKK